ncbi:hypothetical protein T484DRAFT_1934464, partial [Baffinella frigidus]
MAEVSGNIHQMYDVDCRTSVPASRRLWCGSKVSFERVMAEERPTITLNTQPKSETQTPKPKT